MMHQYFQDLEKSLIARLETEPELPSPNKVRALEIARLGARLYSPTDQRAWCGVCAPFDILNAMNVTSCFIEFVGAMLASTGMIIPALEAAEQAGYASDACGYHRGVLGSAALGQLPIPNFIIATTAPCTGGLAALENIARIYKKDMFVLQVPQQSTDDSVAYLADQLKEMISFVAAHTGEALDPERLRLAAEKTNEARAIFEEIYQLAMHVPSPVRRNDLANFGVAMSLFLGTDACVNVARAYRDSYAARIKTGKGGVPGEKTRLLWIQNRMQFKHPLINLIEDEYQASVVIDELNSINWDPIDPDDPYPGIAKRMIKIPLNGVVDHRLDLIRKLARDYRIDGAINPCNFGCRQGTGARGMIQDSLAEIGVPVLNLEVDCVDVRNFSEGQLRTRLEAFLEMLESRPSPWSEA